MVNQNRLNHQQRRLTEIKLFLLKAVQWKFNENRLTLDGNICFDFPTESLMKSSLYLTPVLSFNDTDNIFDVSRKRFNCKRNKKLLKSHSRSTFIKKNSPQESNLVQSEYQPFPSLKAYVSKN